MDLSHEERGEAARNAYQRDESTERDKSLIGAVLMNSAPGITQSLALGANCPYWPNQRRERAAWIREIARQREEVKA